MGPSCVSRYRQIRILTSAHANNANHVTGQQGLDGVVHHYEVFEYHIVQYEIVIAIWQFVSMPDSICSHTYGSLYE